MYLWYSLSIAIWHKNNVALGIASGIWVVNLGFLISGETSPPSIPGNSNRRGLISGVVRVNNHLQLFSPYHLTVSITDSRCMESCSKEMYSNQPRDKPTQSRFLVYHRLSFVTFHARWLATPSSSWWRFLRAWTPPLETGEGSGFCWLPCC